MIIFLLLAAGSSSRMQAALIPGADQPGEFNPGVTIGADRRTPKMLLPFKNKTLLQHTIDGVNHITDSKLLVVTGCFHEQLKGMLEQEKIDFVFNEYWEQGMGASIKKGMQFIFHHFPGATAVAILVCDQPFLTASLLNDMIETKKRSGKGIVACNYNQTTGTPVLFDKSYFDLLANLGGHAGAKKILQEHAADIATVDFPLGAFDIDTREDYDKLQQY